MAFEDLLPKVRDQGRFQILQFIYLAISRIFITSHFLVENFTAFVPEHRCWVHFLDNTSALLNVSGDLNFSSLLKFSIPLDSNEKPERCHRFSWPQWQTLPPNVTGQNLSQMEMEPCMDGWVYDQSIFISSIVTEWDMVCDSQTLKPLSQSIFLTGILVGFLIWGYLTDRFGRKQILTPSFLMAAVFSTGAAFAQSFSVYCCFRFLLGFLIAGVILGTNFLVMEWTNTQHRSLIAVFLDLGISVGHMLLGVLAYGIPEWRKLQLALSAPFFAFFLTIWWLPESPRWLIVHNKYDDALKILRKVANINGVKDKNLTVEDLRSSMEKEPVAAQSHYTMLDLLCLPVLHRRIFCLSFAGFTTGMLFYGLSLDLQNLGHNIQMLQVLLGVSSFLSRFLALFIMYYFGRRTVMVACLLLAGLFLFASVFLSQEILHGILIIVAINCIMLCISCKSVYSTELLPTVIRSMCNGIILTVDRIGAMLAPLVNILKHYIPVLPQIIFAIMAIIASLVIFFLPETRNQPMPDTIQDIERGHSREEASPRDLGDTVVKISQF